MPPSRFNIRAIAPSDRGYGLERLERSLLEAGVGRLTIVEQFETKVLGEIALHDGLAATLLVVDAGLSRGSGCRIYEPLALLYPSHLEMDDA